MSSVPSTYVLIVKFTKFSYAYTGGCDSLVRIWKAESGIDEEPDTALDAEEPVTALATDVRILQSANLDFSTYSSVE